MTLSYGLLHKECAGCKEGVMYSARFYSLPVDVLTPFQMLPRYVGSCSIRVVGTNAHLTRMVFMEAEIDGRLIGHRFENHHHLDLCLRLLEEEPQLETVSYERHKAGGEVARTVRIIDRIRFLARGKEDGSIRHSVKPD